jgi:hypothetical protein
LISPHQDGDEAGPGRSRLLAAAISAATALGAIAGASPAALGAAAPTAARTAAAYVKPVVAYRNLALPNADTATVTPTAWR